MKEPLCAFVPLSLHPSANKGFMRLNTFSVSLTCLHPICQTAKLQTNLNTRPPQIKIAYNTFISGANDIHLSIWSLVFSFLSTVLTGCIAVNVIISWTAALLQHQHLLSQWVWSMFFSDQWQTRIVFANSFSDVGAFFKTEKRLFLRLCGISVKTPFWILNSVGGQQ